MDAVNTQTNNYVHEASSTLMALARLLGKQAAREAAAATHNSSTTTNKEGAGND